MHARQKYEVFAFDDLRLLFEGEYIRAQKESEGVSAELILINK